MQPHTTHTHTHTCTYTHLHIPTSLWWNCMTLPISSSTPPNPHFHQTSTTNQHCLPLECHTHTQATLNGDRVLHRDWVIPQAIHIHVSHGLWESYSCSVCVCVCVCVRMCVRMCVCVCVYVWSSRKFCVSSSAVCLSTAFSKLNACFAKCAFGPTQTDNLFIEYSQLRPHELYQTQHRYTHTQTQTQFNVRVNCVCVLLYLLLCISFELTVLLFLCLSFVCVCVWR